MSINLFFVLLLSLLLGMFGYFKPTLLVGETKKEVPKFELESFVVYEISATGIDRFFEGNHGKRFEDRYEVSSAKFSNNSKDLFESITFSIISRTTASPPFFSSTVATACK